MGDIFRLDHPLCGVRENCKRTAGMVRHFCQVQLLCAHESRRVSSRSASG
ncbi:hypothetical protein PBI_GAIA_73 [Mycobacterium phage Gaia]|uniref:Uncharacterized protein n=1 Tax=Mycobacterium phage Gaia TaxID=1486472 RepID=A0A068F1R9_9CAUD|nr:hypothetical protein VC46_gp160 [Mycobacterium phage Gaia]AID58892.1 hypothetical protein PBI_GAIA_73 [Mycobacterium phage Gaia]